MHFAHDVLRAGPEFSVDTSVIAAAVM